MADTPPAPKTPLEDAAERAAGEWSRASLTLKMTVNNHSPMLAVALNDLEEEFASRPTPGGDA